MQKRHTDRKMYFRDLEITSKEFYISYLSDFTELTSKSRILEVGCGEGGNLVPFAQLGCKVLTSSLRHPKILIKEFSYFLMPCHQHGLRINLLV